MSSDGFEFHVCTLPPWEPRRMRELAEAAHQQGFDRFWVSDQTFHTDPFVALCDLAEHTAIALGLAVTNPYARHPAQLARAMATLAHLHSERRWVFGLGTANPQHVLAPLGMSLTKGPRHVQVAIEVIRALVAGETITVDDPDLVFCLREVRLDIDPPPAFDLYIGTRGPRMLETAGAVADGAIVEAQFTPAGIAWAKERLDAGSSGAGRGRFDRPYIAWQTVELLEEGAAISQSATEFGAMLIAATPAATLTSMGVPGELADGLRSGRLRPNNVPQGQIAKFVAAGTPTELVEMVNRSRAAGADAWSAVMTGTTDEAIEAMHAFGNGVIAKIRASAHNESPPEVVKT